MFVAAIWLSLTNAHAQTKISGKVSDKSGPLPGVSVIVKGKPSVGASTNLEGHFTIAAAAGDILIIRMLGYETREVATQGKSTINITLKEADRELGEVIITGYKDIDRTKNTSATGSISGEEIENLPAASVDVLLQGRLAGVNVQNFSGQPGVSTSLLVRGNTKISAGPDGFNADNVYSAPLYVIDGIPISDDEVRNFDATGTNFLASLNPNIVETIDVLKDASAAALYGARAANGVILIKTKRGKTGAPRFNFNTYHGIIAKPQKVSTLIGAAERRQKLDLIYNYGNDLQLKNNVPVLLTDSLNPAFNNNNDYQEIFYQPGSVHNYDFSAAGGTDAINYRIGAGLYDEKGVIINTGYKRYSFNSNVGIHFSDKLELITSLRASTGKRLVGKGGGGYRNVFKVSPIEMPSSLLKLSEDDRNSITNPYLYERNDNINADVSAVGELRYTFLKDFRISTRGALNYSTSKNDYSTPSNINESGIAYSSSEYSQYRKYIFSNNLLWVKTLGKRHNLNANIIQEFENRKNESIRLTGSAIPNDNIKVVKGVSSGNYGGFSDLSTYSKLSFIGAVHYDYDGKYLFDAVWRGDASSRFGKNNKWGYFPSFSGGWRLSEEEFIRPLTWIEELKLRGSWGRTGDESSIGDATRYNAYLAGSAPYPGATGNNGLPNASSYGGVAAITPNYNGITNDNVTWQRSEEWNIGLDAILFKGRLSANIDYYVRNTTGQLLRILLPDFTGYRSSLTNAAGVRNSGIEFNFSGRVFSPDRAFQWNPSFNISFNKNMVTELPNGNRDLYIGGAAYIVGRPLNMFYGFVVDGIINSTADLIVNPYTGASGATKWGTLGLGFPKWRDVNGDYLISDNGNAEDRTFFGDPNPLATGGFSNLFTYKNFSLNVLTTFTLGRDIMNQTLAKRLQNGLFYGNPEDLAEASITDVSQYNYWRAPGDNATFPALNPYMGLYAWRVGQSLFMEPGWYVRIKSVTMGYRFDTQNNWLKKVRLNSLRLFSTIENVAIFQKFSGIDAERVDGRGFDYGDGYPLPTKVTLGVQVEF